MTGQIIRAAITVHNALVPGRLESIYRKASSLELRCHGLEVAEEVAIPVSYRGTKLECGFRADLVVKQRVLVELKAKGSIHPIDKVQTLSYLRLADFHIGLLINFHEQKLVDGIHRIINGYE